MSDKILKSPFILENADEKVLIDSNAILDEKIANWERKLQREKEEVRKDRISDYIKQISTDEEGNTVFPRDEDGNILIPKDEDGNPLFSVDENGIPMIDEDGFSNTFTEGIGERVELKPKEDLEQLSSDAHAEAERIIAEANEEAERILSDARAQGEALKEHYKEEGRQEGIKEGESQAISEYMAKQSALEEEKTALENEYLEKQKNMERELTDTISDVISKFFKIEFSDNKELLNHIIDNALLHIEGSKNFEIRVSREQFQLVNGRKEDLQKIVGDSATLDVVADPLLKESECLIETDSGVFDCSLDQELDSLIKDIKALSIEG